MSSGGGGGRPFPPSRSSSAPTDSELHLDDGGSRSVGSAFRSNVAVKRMSKVREKIQKEVGGGGKKGGSGEGEFSQRAAVIRHHIPGVGGGLFLEEGDEVWYGGEENGMAKVTPYSFLFSSLLFVL